MKLSSNTKGYRQSAFTLLELLVTLAVVTIVATVAIPSMAQTVQNNRRTAALNDFLADMHLARSEAITRNSRVSVCASNNGTGCGGGWEDGRVVFADLDGDGVVDAGDTVLRVGSALRKIEVNSDDFPRFLSYRPNGRIMVGDIDDNTGEMTFCDSRGPSHAMLIVISNSGRPYSSHETSNGDLPAC